MTAFDKFLKFEFVLGIEPPKTFLYHSVWFPWSERLAGPSWRSKWSSSPILNPRYWPKKLRFASLLRSTPLVFNWSAWKEKPNIRSSSSHVFTNPESMRQNSLDDFVDSQIQDSWIFMDVNRYHLVRDIKPSAKQLILISQKISQLEQLKKKTNFLLVQNSFFLSFWPINNLFSFSSCQTEKNSRKKLGKTKLFGGLMSRTRW